MNALFLYNPLAGPHKFGTFRLEPVLEKIRGLGISLQLQQVAPGQSRHDSLKLDGKDLLIVFGGDGTIHTILPDLVEWGVPLAVLPAGTANVMARELGIPLDLGAAVELLASSNRRHMNLGQADGCYFHLMAGVGVDGYIISRVGARLKKFLGVAAYWVTGLLNFWRYPLPVFQVTIDGEPFEATLAVVSNSRIYGGHLLVAPEASVFADNLDVCLFSSRNHLRFISYLWGTLRGRHRDYPDVVYRKGELIRVYGDREIPVQLDGELAGTLPREFSLAAKSIEVLVPPAS